MEQLENELFYARVKQKEDAAFNELMQSYSKLLWAVGSRILQGKTGSAQMDLEEVVSDVFLRLWQHPEKFDPTKGTLKSYLCLMMDSLTKNRLRQIKRHEHSNLETVIEPGSDLLNHYQDEQAAWQEVYDLVMTLEEPTRKILIWRLFYDLKPEEITRRSGLSAKEVDNRLYRGKQKLRKRMERNSFFREVESI